MKKLYILSMIAMGLATASCDSYLDINVDPNTPSADVVTPSILMPAAEMNFAATYGNLLRIPAGYHCQHFAQQFGTSNYVDFSQFSQSATRSSSSYTQIYQRSLANLQTVIEKANASGEAGTVLAATVIRVMGIEAMVDVYGEMPYSEALDPANPSPKYDQGKDIYAGLVGELNAAIDLVASASNKAVCTNILYQNGSVNDWVKLANAVKLRLLSRGGSALGMQSELDALVAEGNFPAGDVAYKNWGNESGSMNPYYSEEFATNFGSTQINVIANIAIINTMLQKDSEGNELYRDGRLNAFFNANGSGEFFGGLSGTNNSTANGYSTGTFCRPVASPTMPLSLISKAEVEFFLSEYYARKGDANNAQAHYEAAIEASFASAGAAGAEDCIAYFPYDQANYKQCIGLQKWIALAGVDNFEAYNEMRRLRYPAMSSVKGSDIWSGSGPYNDVNSIYKPGTLYTPYQVFNQVGEGKILERWPYPNSSTSRNSNAPEFPGYSAKVFWAE